MLDKKSLMFRVELESKWTHDEREVLILALEIYNEIPFKCIIGDAQVSEHSPRLISRKFVLGN